MKMTVGEVLDKISLIDDRIDYLYSQLPDPYFEAQEPLCKVIELLEEYKDMLRNANTNIDL